MKRIKFLLVAFFLFSTLAAATPYNCLSDPGDSTVLCNPTQSFAADLPSFGLNVLKIFGVFIGTTAIAYMMFSGFRMVMSQGNEEEVSKAKAGFQWTILGFVLTMLAYVIIYAMSDFLGARDVSPGGTKGLEALNPILDATFGDFLVRMIKNFLILASVISMLLIILSGFRYMTARGNEEQVAQAKSGVQWAVIGLIVILLSYVIVVATAQLFGANVTNNP